MDSCEIKPTDVDEVREVLDRVGDKWSLLIFRALREGPLRFTELQRATPGISQRMLTLTLRALQRDGLVSRTAYAESPPRVEYAIAPLGQTFIPVVIELVNWAVAHQVELRENRDTWDDALDASA